MIYREIEKKVRDHEKRFSNNKSLIIGGSQFVANQYTWNHTMNNDDLIVNFIDSDTNEPLVPDYKILDKNNILIRNSVEHPNIKVVLSASYYQGNALFGTNVEEFAGDSIGIGAKKVRLKDGNGVVENPVTDSDAVYMTDGTTKLTKKISDIGASLEQMESKIDDQQFINWWTPPTQNGYTHLNFEEIINKYYEPLRTKYSEVSRIEIGKDQSGLYPFYEYKFEPIGYEKTIILSGGVHADEVHGYISLANFITQVYENWKSSNVLSYLRWKTRIIILPIMNPWGAMQVPLSKVNSRNVEINRNYGFRWRLNDQVYQGTKGSTEFSENETKHIRTVIDKYKDSALFWCDFHTSAPNGEYNNKWLDVAVANELMYSETLKPILNVCEYFKIKYNVSSNIFSNLYSNSQNWGRYARNLFTFTPEYNHNGFVTVEENKRYSSEDMTYALEWYGNLIIQTLFSDIKPYKLFNGNIDYFINSLIVSDGLNDECNYDWNTDDIYNMYDNLKTKYPNYITKNEIGKTSDNNSIYEYVLTPSTYNKTVLLNSNSSGMEIKAMLVLYKVVNLICENYELTNKLCETIFNTRFVIIPVTNLYGLNTGNTKEERIKTNVNNQIIGDFSLTNSEHTSIKNLFGRYTFDYVIDVMGTIRNFGFNMETQLPFKVVKSDTFDLSLLNNYLKFKQRKDGKNNFIGILGSNNSNTLGYLAKNNNVKSITLFINDNGNFSPTFKVMDRFEFSTYVEFVLNTIISL